MINKHSDTSIYWKKYNKEKDKLIKKIINFNDKFQINYLENGHFNHTRDLFALSLTNFKAQKKRINILDYGSNLLTLCNLTNKIDCNRFNFIIFDPFYKKTVNKIKIKNTKYKIVNNEKLIKSSKFGLLHFGSSIQYEEKILEKIENLNLDATKIILFTHTPFSFEKPYSSVQSNHLQLTQYIHSFKKITNALKKKIFI